MDIKVKSIVIAVIAIIITWYVLDGFLDTKSYLMGLIIGNVSQFAYWFSQYIFEQDEPRESR
jgi:hypothetical protein